MSEYHEKDFLEIPETLRTWFGSSEVMEKIALIFEEHNLPPEVQREVPNTVWKLETKQIAPEAFTETLSHALALDGEKVYGILDSLYDSVLAPVARDLLAFGIDIEKIDRRKTVGTPDVERAKPAHTPAPSPFILHREERVKSVVEEVKLPPTLPRRPLYTTERSSALRPTGTVIARLDYAGKNEEERRPKEPLKVSFSAKKLVHYSDLRTPTNPFGKQRNDGGKEEKEQREE